MKKKENSKEKKKRPSHSAYGDKVPICTNIDCILRKKARCYGFEGCPGYKSK